MRPQTSWNSSAHTRNKIYNDVIKSRTGGIYEPTSFHNNFCQEKSREELEEKEELEVLLNYFK
jgi:hypothetical protein